MQDNATRNLILDSLLHLLQVVRIQVNPPGHLIRILKFGRLMAHIGHQLKARQVGYVVEGDLLDRELEPAPLVNVAEWPI